jgi:hypothetical protein
MIGCSCGFPAECTSGHVSIAQLTGVVEPGESLLQRLVRLDAILMERPRPPPHADDGDVLERVVSVLY